MTTPRLAPPFWRHDAYTLGRLARGVERVAAALRDTQGSKVDCVLDLGAGDAPYRAIFERPQTRYVECDLAPGSAVVIRPGEPVPLPDRSAAVVLSFQVLEHVWDLDWYLGEARRLLRDDGSLVLSTHGTWLYHPHPTDFRRWTRDGLVAELTTRGFVVREITGLVGPLAWTTQFRALGYHRLLSAIPVVGSFLSAVLSSLFHVRMHLEDKLTPPEWIATNAAVYLVVAVKAPSSTSPT